MNKYILLLVASVVISSFSQILLKMSARQTHESQIKEYLNSYVITGYLLLFIATITTILAYKGLDYKNGPIIESLSYLLIMLLSYKFFNEKINKRKLVGNILILVGIIVFYM